MPTVGKARDSLVCLDAELLELESHIRTVRDSIQSAITQSVQASQPPPPVLDEGALAARIARSVAARLATRPEVQKPRKGFVREREAAEYLGVKVATLRAWRTRRSKHGPPFARLGRMVMYPVAELEKHMGERVVPPRD